VNKKTYIKKQSNIMNENFKKVIEAIAEMKSMFAKTSMEFAEATLMDGTVISYEGDLAVGTAVFVVADGEQIPAPEGTHALGGELEGVSIVTDAEGIIVEVIDERAPAEEVAASEEVEESAPEVVEQSMSAEEVESIVSAKMEIFSGFFSNLEEMIQSIANENETLRQEMNSMKADFETFKSAPSNEVTEGEKFSRHNSNLTSRQLFLRNQLKNN